MVAANDTALQDAPKAFNRVGVESAHNVLLITMIDGAALKSLDLGADRASRPLRANSRGET